MSAAISIDDRLRFIGLNEELRKILREFLPALEREIPRILDLLYRRMLENQSLAQMFASQARIAHAQNAQAEHWRRMFSARYDDAYVRSVRTIGETHNKLGLEPSWYIGAYTVVMAEVHGVAARLSGSRLAGAAAQQRAEALIRAIDMAVMLDIDLVIGVYLDARSKDYHDRLETLAVQFDESFTGITTTITDTATELSRSAVTLRGTAERTSEQATSAATSSAQTSSNVQTVASAAEELSASISEITTQVTLSTSESRSAAQAVGNALDIVGKLSDAAEQISGVVNLIQGIAKQTNLLALNATIEAARAGEAGKGFAVVAGEVKSLAQQTAHATDGIIRQVDEIRGASDATATAIASINEAISRVQEMSQAIAGAVEEQNAVTQEISRSVSEASVGTRNASDTVEQVKQQADETMESAAAVSHGSQDVLAGIERLRAQAAAFLDRIRAAERREHERDDVVTQIQVQFNGTRIDAMSSDVSKTGLGLRFDTTGLRIGDRGIVGTTQSGGIKVVVRAVNPGRAHVEFEDASSAVKLVTQLKRAA